MCNFTIPHLRDIIEKEGIEYVEEMLKTGIFSINIKVDQMSFNVRVGENYELIFLKRNGNEILTPFDRIANWHYGTAIELLKYDIDRLKNFSVGSEFYFEFFPYSGLPSYLKYDFIPKMRFVLSYVYDPDSGIRKTISAKENPFCVEDSPTIFIHSVFFNEEVKEILDITQNPKKVFSDFVRNTFQNSMNSYLDRFIPQEKFEGLVFFNADPLVEPEYQVFKMIDPKFTDWKNLQDNNENTHLVSMFYHGLVSKIFDWLEDDFNEVIDSNGWENYEGIEKYLTIISFLTDRLVHHIHPDFWYSAATKRKFVEDSRFTQIDCELLKFYNINFEIFEYCWYANDIFRILMFWLSKPRKQISFKNGITKHNKDILNDCVNKLQKGGFLP